MATRHERAADKLQNEKHQQILKAMLQRPENRNCADCRKRDPRWVSWNLGVFICIRCSGIHRSMGTHISKVKSVDLDTWTPEQIANVQRWGNATANKYWEARLTKEPTESTVNQWVWAKYERKQFAMPGPMPEPEQLSDAASPTQQHQQQKQEPPRQQLQLQPQQQFQQATARLTPTATPDFGPSGSPAPSSRPTSGSGDPFLISKPPGSNSPGILCPPVGNSPRPGQVQAQPQPQQQPSPQRNVGNQDFKSTIMSLYGAQPPQQANANPQLQFNSFGTQPQQQQQQQQGLPLFYPQQDNQQGQQQFQQLPYQAQYNPSQQNQQVQQPPRDQYFSGTGYPQQISQGSQPQSQYGAYVTGGGGAPGSTYQDGGGYGSASFHPQANPLANNAGSQQGPSGGSIAPGRPTNQGTDAFASFSSFGK